MPMILKMQAHFNTAHTTKKIYNIKIQQYTDLKYIDQIAVIRPIVFNFETISHILGS